MALVTTNHAAIRGVAASVPDNPISNLVLEKNHDDIGKTSSAVGIDNRYVTSSDICTSDLCLAAANRLLDELGWDRKSVDGLIFLSQTGDYILPATSCVLQYKLGLNSHCLAFDMALGCSGYVYGLLTTFSLIRARGLKRIILLAGDTISKVISPNDMPANVLFGDAGTATAIEFDEEAEDSYFSVGTDGSGYESLIIEAGGFRKPKSNHTNLRKEHNKDKVIRSEEELFMDGSAVFSFALSRVPESIKNLLSFSEYKITDVDHWLFHQANKFMLSHLAKKSGIDEKKMPSNINEFGNTSPPSIPLLMTTHGKEIGLDNSSQRIALVGFGVGLSWGSTIINTENIVLPDLIYLGKGDLSHESIH